jgi:hypothetical protein
MNTQYASFLVIVLANVLPMLGVEIANDQLTVTVQVVGTISAALWGILSGWRSGQHTLGGRSL